MFLEANMIILLLLLFSFCSNGFPSVIRSNNNNNLHHLYLYIFKTALL